MIKIGDKVVLSKYFKKRYPTDLANNKFGKNPRRVISKCTWAKSRFCVEGLDGHGFEPEWLEKVNRDCKFMKKKV